MIEPHTQRIDLSKIRVDVAAARAAGACQEGVAWAEEAPRTLADLAARDWLWADWYAQHVLAQRGENDLSHALAPRCAAHDWVYRNNAYVAEQAGDTDSADALAARCIDRRRAYRALADVAERLGNLERVVELRRRSGEPLLDRGI